MDIAIVDDMNDEIGSAKTMLKDYSALNNIKLNIVTFSSAEAFLKKFRPFLYTVIFMDIYIDGMTGIEAAEQIRKLDCSVIIIFLTTSDEHLHEAFRCHAYEYLIKPVVREKIFRTMDDILKITTDSDSKRLNFTGQRREYSLKYSDILYIQTKLSRPM